MHVEYNDPFFASVGHGRKYALNMTCTPLERLPEFDCVGIVTDNSQYDYAGIVEMTKQVVDTRNASMGIAAVYIVRCRSIDIDAPAGTDLAYLRFFTLPPSPYGCCELGLKVYLQRPAGSAPTFDSCSL
ncbi:MAG: hypothetical protein ABSG62_15410 [Terracidiphilus sp.]